MGHVDHGKTKILDVIRKTAVAEKESGGITQHIGAYQVELTTSDPKGEQILNGTDKRRETRKITFLDTPGHEAFAAIRSRGIKVADIAVLVVAADEGVKPQTKEAIAIINEEKIPTVVAINKIDKEGANIQRVKQELAAENILVEDWGGKIPVVEISAKQNKNIGELLDMILLVAELENLQEDLSPPAKGVIIESNLDKRKGYVATALVQKGKLRTGDWIAAGTTVGKIKFMEDFLGRLIIEAVPSQPVRIIGLSSSPAIGKEFIVANSRDEASNLAAENANLAPLFRFFKGIPESKETIDKNKTLNIIFKSDVSSSLEAIESALGAIKSEEVACRVVSHDIGNVSESDIKFAIGSGALVVGFRVEIDPSAKKLAEKENVKVATFSIIYELAEYIRQEMSKLLEPEIRRTLLGKVKILAVFKKDSKSQIIGGKVISGKITRGTLADVVRNNAKLLGGRIIQLQQNKQDASEVNEGFECGMKFESLPNQPAWDIKEGDVLEVYGEEKIPRNL